MKQVQKLLGAVTWFSIFSVLSASLGLLFWLIVFFDGSLNLKDNQLDGHARTTILISIVVSVLVSFGALIIGYNKYGKKQDWGFGEFCFKVNHFASILLIPVTVSLLRILNMDDSQPFLSVFASLFMGAIAINFFYRFYVDVLEPRKMLMPFQPKAWKPTFVVVIFVLTYTVVISSFQITHHQNMGTRAWDFGLYIQSLWHSLHGNFLGCSFLPTGNHTNRHFDPILVFISPILLIWRNAQILFVFQAFWVGLGAVPVFLFFRRRFQNPLYGIMASAIYLLHPAVNAPNMYEFHSLTLAGATLLWLMYALESRKYKMYFVFLTLLLLIREDMPALAIFIGLYAILTGKAFRVGLITIVVSMIYGGFVNFVVIADSYSYKGYLKKILIPGKSMAMSIVLTLITNPLFMLQYAFSNLKVLYLLKLVVPFLLLPVFAKKRWLLFLWGLGVTFFGSKKALFQINMQYTVFLIPFLMMSIPGVIERIVNGTFVRTRDINPDAFRSALFVGMLAATISMSSLYGVFWPNESFKAGYERFLRYTTDEQAERYETIKEIQSIVPEDATIWATLHICPHFALRDHIWCLERPREPDQPVEYIMTWKQDIERKLHRKLRRKRLKQIKQSKEYKVILKKNDITLYQRIKKPK